MQTRPRTPRGFTVIEALVAIVTLGVAGGLLAAAFTVSTAARRRALLDVRGASWAQQRMALLAARSCLAADTSDSARSGPASEAWSAMRAADGWAFVDSVSVAGAPARAAFRGTVACR